MERLCPKNQKPICEMTEEQRQNEAEIPPTIQMKELPLLLRPKQTLRTVRDQLENAPPARNIGAREGGTESARRQVQRRYSPPLPWPRALGVDLMAENYTLLAGTSFTKELGDRLTDSSSGVLTKTREMIQVELHGHCTSQSASL